MKTEMKVSWSKPQCITINLENTEQKISASACSYYCDCRPFSGHIESIPGKPPVETM